MLEHRDHLIPKFLGAGGLVFVCVSLFVSCVGVQWRVGGGEGGGRGWAFQNSYEIALMEY